MKLPQLGFLANSLKSPIRGRNAGRSGGPIVGDAARRRVGRVGENVGWVGAAPKQTDISNRALSEALLKTKKVLMWIVARQTSPTLEVNKEGLAVGDYYQGDFANKFIHAKRSHGGGKLQEFRGS